MEKLVYDLTYEQEKTQWWFRVRRKIVFDIIKKFSKLEPQATILDAGCGTGFLLQELQKTSQAWGVDSSQEALNYCCQRGLQDIKKGDILALPFENNSFEVVLLLDVLEHIEDDNRALKEVYRVLKKEGFAIIFVPAFQSLWSVQDEISHHCRRYRLKQLARKIEKANFKILKASYFNTFLFLPIAFLRFFLRFFKIKIKAENYLTPKLLNFLLYAIFWLESLWLKYLNFPFGVSLLFVVKKP